MTTPYWPAEFGLTLVSGDCVECRQPLHTRSGDPEPFCPSCAIDALNARKGRELLGRIQRELQRQRLMTPRATLDDPGAGRYMFGMPL